MKRFFLLTVFLLCSVSAFAEMTIYMKDGSEHRVRSITFRENKTAELRLMDGRVITFPVEKIDLPSSGIFVAQGTYGETPLSGRRKPAVGQRPAPGGPVKQEVLKREWDSSDKIARTVKPYKFIRTGDEVRILREPSSDKPLDRRRYWYYEPAEQVAEDKAYIIIYRGLDGNFTKFLLDASTFAAHFRYDKPPASPAYQPPAGNPGQVPIPPGEMDPGLNPMEPPLTGPTYRNPPTQEQEPKVAEDEDTQEAEPVAQAPEVNASSGSEESEVPATPFFIGAGVLALLAGAGAGLFLMRKKEKPFLQESMFSKFEAELRDFELEIWLKNGKTYDQLVEIATKKFFQDNPSALMVAMKMLKGSDRASVVPIIIREARKSSSESDRIYNIMQERIERNRKLVAEVSNRTGLAPAAAPVVASQKAASPPRADQRSQTFPTVVEAATLHNAKPPAAAAAPSTSMKPAAAPPVSSASAIRQASSAYMSTSQAARKLRSRTVPEKLPAPLKSVYRNFAELG